MTPTHPNEAATPEELRERARATKRDAHEAYHVLSCMTEPDGKAVASIQALLIAVSAHVLELRADLLERCPLPPQPETDTDL